MINAPEVVDDFCPMILVPAGMVRVAPEVTCMQPSSRYSVDAESVVLVVILLLIEVKLHDTVCCPKVVAAVNALTINVINFFINFCFTFWNNCLSFVPHYVAAKGDGERGTPAARSAGVQRSLCPDHSE